MHQRASAGFLTSLCLLAGVVAGAAGLVAQGQPPPQGVPENAITHVSDHVSAIVGFPNIGIVVGTNGTLVVDTGMGARNGAIVVREARKLAKGPKLYLTTTHFHPEHTTGEQAFPAGTVLIRPAVQQAELDAMGRKYIDLFMSRSALNKELLQDVHLRTPDIVFDREQTLDLGGVTARLLWYGGGHTKGDELIFVEPDGVLLPGDIVQNKLVPNFPDENASVKGWIALLDKIQVLAPRFIVTDHGALGDASLVAQERTFLVDLQSRALALKKQGVAVDAAASQLAAEFKTKYPDWQGAGVPNAVRRVYAEQE